MRSSAAYAWTLATVLICTPLAAQQICTDASVGERIVLNGTAEVIDGDTMWLGIFKVRLYGVEALESDQPCVKSGENFRCSEQAFDAFNALVTDKNVRCHVDRGKFGKPIMDRNRYLATCFVEGRDIGRELVATGWVLADERSTGDVYREQEAAARKSSLGMYKNGNHLTPAAAG